MKLGLKTLLFMEAPHCGNATVIIKNETNTPVATPQNLNHDIPVKLG